jgi:hypothetical protein
MKLINVMARLRFRAQRGGIQSPQRGRKNANHQGEDQGIADGDFEGILSR